MNMLAKQLIQVPRYNMACRLLNSKQYKELKEKYPGPDRIGVPDDYPDPPFISYQLRPVYGWWDKQGRRNLETPLHEQDDALSMFLWDAEYGGGRTSNRNALLQLLSALGVIGLFAALCNWYDSKVEVYAVPKRYLRNNLYIERGGDPDKEPENYEDNRVSRMFP